MIKNIVFDISNVLAPFRFKEFLAEKGFDNAEPVYAGLTYGRGTLNESVAEPGANRGFSV